MRLAKELAHWQGKRVSNRCSPFPGTVLAEEAGRDDIAAAGWREISWVQFLRAQCDRADESLTRTAEVAAGRNHELPWVDTARGACRRDTGHYAATGELLRSAVERAASSRRGSRPRRR